MKHARRWLLAIVFVAVVAACGGSRTPTETATVGTAPSMQDNAPASPPAAELEPTATPDPLLSLEQITPIPLEQPLTGVDALLGSIDRRAATAIRESLTADGFDLADIDFFVFPLPGESGNLLVIEIETRIDSDLADDQEAVPDMQPLLRGLAESDAFAAAAIERIAMNSRVVSAEGDEVLIFTMTQPADVFVAFLTGAITEEQALAQTLYELKQVAPE